MKHLFILIILFLTVTGISATANPQYPVKTVNGEDYYEYTISAGEGLYSIARRFGIKQSDLHKANPNLTTDIKVGQKIFIPVKNENQNQNEKLSGQLPIHIVEPKQTLYGISKMYNIPIDTLIALNPDAINGIKIGDTLILSRKNNVTPIVSPITEEPDNSEQNPTSLPATHFVKRKETLYSISKKYNIPIHEILENNPGIGNVLKAEQIIIINPQALKQQETINFQSADTATNEITEVTPADPTTSPYSVTSPIYTPDTLKDPSLKIIYLLPFMTDEIIARKATERFLDFYRGSIIAMKEAKDNGISATIYSFDTQKKLDRIDSILTLPELQTADIIIGPAYSDQLTNVIDFARNRDIATIIPFSAKIPDSLYYDKLIQFNPPQEYLFNQVAEAVKNTGSNSHNYIIGRFASGDTKGDAFADAVISNFSANSIPYTETQISIQSIDSIVQTAGTTPTTILLASTSPVDVNLILEKLSAYSRPNIRIWGFEEWEALTHKYPNTVYHSLFNTKEPAEYHNTYNKIFGSHGNATGVRYDLIGYDLTMLALQGITINNDRTLQINNIKSVYVQSQPSLTIDESRLLNNHFYLFRWNGYSTEILNR